MNGRLPIAIVGAGPVGLTAALALARLEVPVMLVEKRPALSNASKASTFHPPTLAILEALGICVGELPGQRVERVAFIDVGSGRSTTLALEVLRDLTPFPFRLHLEQSEITPLLLEAAQRFDGTLVRFGAELVGIEAMADRVRLRLGDGSSFDAALLVAADGARSRARSLAGIDFGGKEYPHHVLRLMSPADMGQLVPSAAPLTYLFNEGLSLSLLKMRDCWRTILRVPRDVPEAEAVDPSWWGPQLEAVLPVARTALGRVDADLFAVSRRVAARYAAGRVLLIGDAAHLTNTRGGMNMNAGLHDAWEMAGAVAAYWREGDSAPLEAVAAHRRRIALEMLIPRTDRSVSGPRWFDDVVRMTRDPASGRDYLARASMLDMVVSPSAAASGSAASAP